MSDVTDQIKERLSVVELIGDYLKLEKAGTNYKALCPFHNEKTPSFMVNPERNFWYCFGCQKGGDIFTFIMEMEGMEFREALERLADRSGVEIPKFNKKVNQQEKNQKEKLYEITEIANNFFQEQLWKNSSDSEKVVNYLAGRHIDKDLSKRFRIGLAPESWSYLLDFLLNKGCNLVDIAKTGLVVQKNNTLGDKKNDYYDRFRGRITFPVTDQVGKVVGHSARVLPGADESSAKYINTPQTQIYDKSRILYGLDLAKTAIKKMDFVIVVEGNLDVIASFASGVENVVAVSGTALTPQQVDILKRYTKNVKLCFDMDEAGQNAISKSVQTCLEKEVDTEIILLPEGFKDVNDLVIYNSRDWEKSIEGSYPVMEYFFSVITKKYDRNNVKGKRLIAHEFLNIIKHISDPIEQSYWIKKLSEKIQVEEDTLTQVLEKVKINSVGRNENKSERKETLGGNTKKTSQDRVSSLQERLLGLFSLYREELKDKIQGFDSGIFDEEYLKIWNKIIEGDLGEVKDKVGKYEVKVKYDYDDKAGFAELEVDPVGEWEKTLNYLIQEKKRKQLNEIVWDIKKAEEEGDSQNLELLMEYFSQLSRELKELEN
ncbi:MAG: DNA primase [Candidatus Moraniibacteriota bacterium]